MLQRDWEFRVAAKVSPGEYVCVVGNCTQLGNWYHTSALFLECETNKDGVDDEDIGFRETVWAGKTSLPLDSAVEYRYAICFVVEPSPSHLKREIIVRRWETNVKPRRIPASACYNPQNPSPPETFGTYNNETHVDRGWLTCETAVQLKFFNDPVQMWKRSYKGKQFRIKVTPVEIASDTYGSDLASMNLDESLDVHELHTGSKSWPIVEVAAMDDQDCYFKLQGQYGRAYQPGECVIFQTYVLNPAAMAFLIDIYLHNPGQSEGEAPQHAGFCYLLQSNMPESEGRAVLPLTSVMHQPIGQIRVEYLIVKPLQDFACDMSVSYAKHWKHSWRGLEVGHRGAGSSFKDAYKSCASIRENTIASLAYAASHGADIVELDVQLSKDLVPVIYHDFHINIAMKRKRRTTHDEHDLLKLPVKDLTLEQLHMLKDEQRRVSKTFKPSKVLAFWEEPEPGELGYKEVYHLNEGNGKNSTTFTESDEDDDDHQPFPTLQHALERLDPHVGFNVEIKWTMQLKDGTYELYHPFEVNMYLDTMVKAVLQFGSSRKMVFSCFHPDICTMLRLKQNKYPVLFLTQGITKKYPAYHDPRTHNIPMGISFALSADILGINVHTEDLLREPSQVALVHRSNLILFCWGEDNNDQQIIRYLKELGLDGIIYDKIDVYSLKETKESIFLVEAREAQKELLEVASHPSQGIPPPGLLPPTTAVDGTSNGPY